MPLPPPRSRSRSCRRADRGVPVSDTTPRAVGRERPTEEPPDVSIPFRRPGDGAVSRGPRDRPGRGRPEGTGGRAGEGEPSGLGPGQLPQGRGTDPGPELHRLPQPQEVGEQVRHDHVRRAGQGGSAGRRGHARTGRPRGQLPRRVDPARRRAPDALQARPVARRQGGRHRAVGRAGGEVRRGQPRRGLDRRLAQEYADRDPRRLCRGRADHGAGVQPRRRRDRRVGLSRGQPLEGGRRGARSSASRPGRAGL